VVIVEDSIRNGSIPDVEYGQVTSKAPAPADSDMQYIIKLADGKTLYVAGNQTLYDTVKANLTYVFTCHIDFNNHRVIAESAWQTNRTAT
jgi:hypothetical protein